MTIKLAQRDVVPSKYRELISTETGWVDKDDDGTEYVVSTDLVRYAQLTCVNYTVDTEVGDGVGYIHIPANLDTWELVEVHAKVITAGTTGTTDIQIYNLTQTADMLSTKITIDSGETGSDTATTAPVIDTANDDVAENDVIRIDVDAISTTAAKGLIVTIGFQKP